MLRKVRKNYRRFVSFLLAFVMTFTNVGSNLGIAFAGGEDQEVLYQLSGEDLQAAIQDAVAGGEVCDPEEFAFGGTLKEDYEELFDGNVYQLDVDAECEMEVDGASMEVYYDADKEQVVFLFVNESDMIVDFSVDVDGYMVENVVVKPNASQLDPEDEKEEKAIGDANAQAPENHTSSDPNAAQGPSVEAGPGVEAPDDGEDADIVIENPEPEENGADTETNVEVTPDADGSEIVDGAEDPSANDGAADAGDTAVEDVADANDTEADNAAGAENEAADTNDTAADDVADVEDAAADDVADVEDAADEVADSVDTADDAGSSDEAESADEGQAVAVISLHEVAKVAVGGFNIPVPDGEDAVETKIIRGEETAPETEEDDVVVEPTEQETEDPAHEEQAPEAQAPEEQAPENPTPEEQKPEEPEAAPVDPSVVPDIVIDPGMMVDPAVDAPSDNENPAAPEAPAEGTQPAEPEVEIQPEETPAPEENTAPAPEESAEPETSGTVTVPVETEETEETKGADVYGLVSVWNDTANARAAVVKVAELNLDLVIEEVSVELAQTVDGVTVKVNAEEGVLPENTEMTVEAVELSSDKGGEQWENLVAATEEDEVAAYAGVLAYDITLHTEEEENVQPDGPVTVTFDGTGWGGALEGARVIIYHIADDNSVEKIAETEAGDSISFEAEHFSTYAMVAEEPGVKTIAISGDNVVKVGESITLTSDVHNWRNHLWKSSDDTIAKIEEKSSTSYTGEVTGVAPGKVTITHTYGPNGRPQAYTETYEVIVTAIAGKASGIIFEYHEDFEDLVAAKARNIVKYKIDCIDENGNKVSIPEGAVIPGTIEFAGPIVTIDENTFAEIDIPGFANDGAYCYFYWQGAYTGTKYPVTSFKNTGRISDRYWNYDSYIGYTSTQGTGDDYYNDNTGEYFAYNPTGTLVVVFVKHPIDAPDTNYEDAFGLPMWSSGRPVGKHEDRSVWSNREFTYYPYDLRKTYDKDYMESHFEHEGYVFVGWSTERGLDGNGDENSLVKDTYFNNKVDRDVTLYATWKKGTPGLTASKTLTNGGSGENGAFKAGETATFDIVVKNTGDTTQKNVTVSEMEGAAIVEGEGYEINEAGQAVIEKMAPGAEVVVKAKYTVTQEDIDSNAELKNIALVDGDNGTDPGPKPEVKIPEEAKNPELTSVKTLTNGKNADGSERRFKAGETAEFDIVVENTGNTTQKNVTVSEMEGAAIVEGEGYEINEAGQAVIEKMAPGAKVTVKATYKVTQEDIDSDETLANVAKVNGKDTNPEPIPEEEKNSGLTATKTLTNGKNEDGSERRFKAGETAKFDIVVENTGNTTQHGVVVTESMDGAKIVAGDGYTLNADGTATIPTIEVGNSVTVKAEYEVTQDDIDNQTVLANTATVKGGGETTGPGSVSIPTEEKKPGLTSNKSVTNAPEGGFKAGETAEFVIKVTNSGNTTQTNVTVTEELDGAKIVDGEGYKVNEAGQAVIEEMAPGATVTVKATYMVTQADIDSDAELKNIAKVNSNPTNPVTIPEEKKNPNLTSVKNLTNSGTGEGGSFKVGETATFTITVTNSGNTTQKNVTVTEQLPGAQIVAGDGYTINGTGQAVIEEMAPGAVVVVNAEYTVTQADIDSNAVLKNEALVDGEGPDDPTPKVEIPKEAQNPEWKIEKKVDNEGRGSDHGKFKVGETIRYQILITNEGNTTLNDLPVKDAKFGTDVNVYGDGITHKWVMSDAERVLLLSGLAPGKSAVITYSYTVTEEDVIKGHVENTAIAGKDAGEERSTVTTETEEAKKNLTSKKRLTNEGSGEDGAFKVGETATFDIVVENDGNITQKGVVVTDTLPGAKIVVDEENPGKYEIDESGRAVIGEIKPGDKVTVKAEYTITQADIDSDETLKNTATVEGAGTTPDPDPAPIPTEKKNREWTVEKTVINESLDGGEFKVGEKILYQVIIENTGNTTLNGLEVKDAKFGNEVNVYGDRVTHVWAGETLVLSGLAPHKRAVVTYSYTVTEEDVLKGSVENTVTAGIGEIIVPADLVTPTEKAVKNLVSEKKLTNQGTGENGAFKVGETAKFDIVVRNEGNITQKDVVVTEQLTGAQIVDGEGYTVNEANQAEIAEMAPGTEVIVKAIYTVTQADIDSDAKLKNIALVNGDNGTKPDPAPEVEIPKEEKNPAWTVDKTVENEGSDGGKFRVGETIRYQILIENTGNTTLNGLVVTDEKFGIDTNVYVAGATYEKNGKTLVFNGLAPGKRAVVTYSYKVTEEDVLKGSVENTAITNIGDTVVTDKVDTSTEEAVKSLESEKKLTNGGTGENGAFKANEKATFNITVTNTGNVTQWDVVVHEKLNGAIIIEGNGYTLRQGDAFISELKPGESVTVNAEYTVTQADIDSDAELRNVVLVSGTEGTDPKEPETEIPVEEKKPGLTATKSITNAPAEGFKAGQTAKFDITVTNSGNTTQKNVTVTEQLDGAKIVAGNGYTINEAGKAVIAEMAPGAEVVVKAEYTVTQADIDSGAGLKNVALVEGDNGDDPAPTPEIPIPEEAKNPGLKAVKSVTNAPEGGFKAGQTAEFDITVTNSGNTTQTNVTVTEQLAGASIVEGEGYTINEAGQAVITEMAPGADVVVKAKYTVTQEDIDSDAELKNIATVKGDNGTDPDPEPGVVIPEEEKKPGLTSTKKVTNSGSGENNTFKAGETAEFDITVTNSGNTTQTNVTVTEQLAGATIVAGEGYTINEAGQAVIAEMAPNATVVVKATYTVTQEDIDSDAELKNIALVKGNNGENPDPTPETKIPEEEKKPGLKSVKTVTNAGSGENDTFKAGETATFDITVTNSGNTTQTNVIVTEQLAGATIVAGEGYTINEAGQAVIAEMAPGAIVVVKATYTVTQDDIDSEGVPKNVAFVEGDTGEEELKPEVEIPVESWKITKRVTNLPARQYFLNGEVAEFEITVTNHGEKAINNIVVTDDLAGAQVVEGDGYTINEIGRAVIDTLAPGTSVIIYATYTVTRDDVSRGHFNNIAVATGTPDGEDIGERKEVETPDIPTGSYTGGGSSGGGGGGGSTGGTSTGTTTITDAAVPLATIDPGEVPLAALPQDLGPMTAIDDEGVPLAAILPKTGDTSRTRWFLIMAILSLFGLGALETSVRKEKRKEEE